MFERKDRESETKEEKGPKKNEPREVEGNEELSIGRRRRRQKQVAERERFHLLQLPCFAETLLPLFLGVEYSSRMDRGMIARESRQKMHAERGRGRGLELVK